MRTVTEQHFQRRYASTVLQWINCTTGISDDTLHCIRDSEWEWHKSLPVNGKTYVIYQFNEKHEFYTEMQWTFDIQAILEQFLLQNNKNTWEK